MKCVCCKQMSSITQLLNQLTQDQFLQLLQDLLSALRPASSSTPSPPLAAGR